MKKGILQHENQLKLLLIIFHSWRGWGSNPGRQVTMTCFDRNHSISSDGFAVLHSQPSTTADVNSQTSILKPNCSLTFGRSKFAFLNDYPFLIDFTCFLTSVISYFCQEFFLKSKVHFLFAFSFLSFFLCWPFISTTWRTNEHIELVP